MQSMYVMLFPIIVSINSASESAPPTSAVETPEQSTSTCTPPTSAMETLEQSNTSVVSTWCYISVQSSSACTLLILQVSAEVDVLTSRLLPHEDVVSLFTKSKNRGNLAALLVARLFDKETRSKLNVRGQGKPKIIKYIR